MKKIIMFILIAVSFNFAMTLAESKTEVNHCHTRFEKVIDSLKGCKIDKRSLEQVYNAVHISCKNGVFYTDKNFEMQYVEVKNNTGSIKVVLISPNMSRFNGWTCWQDNFDEFGVIEKEKILYHYTEDQKRIYKYAKTKLLGK